MLSAAIVLLLAAQITGQTGADVGVTILPEALDRAPIVAPGQTVAISIGVNNLRGGADAQEVRLTVKLPHGLSLQGSSVPPASTQGDALQWNVGSLAAGALPHIIELKLNLANSAAPGSPLTVEASVSTVTPEENAKNNRAAFNIDVAAAVPELAIDSGLGGVPITFEEPASFTVQVLNTGLAPAPASTLRMTLSPGITLTSADPSPASVESNVAMWQLGDVEVGAVRKISMAISAAEKTKAAKLQFDVANKHLEVTKPVEHLGPNLQIWIVAEGLPNAGELPAGKDVPFAIKYGNYGNRPASGVNVSLRLPSGLSAAQSSWDVASLGAGESATARTPVHVTAVPDEGTLVLAKISAPGAATHSARAYFLGPGPPPGQRHHRAAAGPLSRWWILIAILVASAAAVAVAYLRR